MISIPRHSRRLSCLIPNLSKRGLPVVVSLSLTPLDCKNSSSCNLFDVASVLITQVIALEVSEIIFSKDDLLNLPAGVSKMDLLGVIQFNNSVK